jgi:ankyrin repeat protein
MARPQKLLAAIDAGDVDGVAAILAADPTLAASLDSDGVSLVMHALYRNQRAAAEAVAACLPALDVFEAAALDRAAAVRQLLAADPGLATAWYADGFTALHFAAFFGGGGSASALLGAGADPNLRSRNDFAVMPLHSAVAGRHADVAVALLDAGADPNVRQRHGWTPLQGAAEHGDADLVERLLAAGADPATTNDDGTTAADLARAAGHEVLAARLSAIPR